MKQKKLLKTIPTVLRELHAAGRPEAYRGELGQQVTRHDKRYMARRKVARQVLGSVGISMKEVPSGFTRPNADRMAAAIKQLKQDGVIERFDEPRTDVRAARVPIYRLKDRPVEPGSEDK